MTEYTTSPLVTPTGFSQKQRFQAVGLVLVTALIFALDLLTPLGVATGALYLFVILATFFVRQKNFTFLMGGITISLVGVGLLLSPVEGTDHYATLNRMIQVAAIVAIVPLILRQIEIQNHLATSNERLDMALHATDEGIWDWQDLHHDAQWWAPKFYKLLGYQPGEISPTFSQFKTFFHPESRAPTLQSLENHLKNGTPFDVNCRLKTRSGTYRWFRIRGKSAQRNPDGPVRMVGSIDDITQQKKAEDKFRLVIEAAPAGMLMIDANGTIVLANQRLASQFGYTPEALLGQSIECLVPVRFQADHPAHRAAFFRSPTPRQMGSGRDLYGLRKDGTEFPVEIGLNPVTTEDDTYVLASVIDITERKRAEAKFRLVIEAAPAGMLMIDANGTIVLANQRLASQFGYTPEALLGQSIECLVPVRFQADHPAHRAAFFRSPTPRQMGSGRDLYGLRKDGTEFPVEIGLNPVTTEDDTYVLASVIDITERKRAEAKFRLVIEAAPAGMLMIDANGTIVLANQRLASQFGYTPEALLGQSIECLVPVRFQADHPAHRAAFFRSPTPRQMGSGRDLYGLRKDGTEFPVEIGLNPVTTEDDTYVLASVIDITARKKQERSLRELSDRLTLATQSAELGIWEWKVQEHTMYWDSQMFSLYGLGPDSESEPYSVWSQALHPEDRMAVMELLQKAGQGEAEFDTEFRILWPDGSIHWLKGTGSMERDPKGMAIRIIGITWDVTETKEAEEWIFRYTRELEVSNRELDDFAHITSHDLKEPLRGIANYGRFLLEDHGPLLPEEGKEQCQTIIKLTQRMENLIESLRQFSQLGRADLTIASNSLDDILEDIKLTLKPRLEETQVTIKRPTPLPVWPCDGIRIREALANLITNGMKYNDKAEKWIEITSRTIEETGKLEISVRDNGIGIPEEHQQNIFRIFRRLHGRDKFGGGDGAGLTIVKKIVERHGGTIRLESAVGKGTTFFIELPCLPITKITTR